MGQVSEQEVLSYFEKLSNWGRWGPEDELGTINHISAGKRAKAAQLVTEGRAISCSRIIGKTPAPGSFMPPMHFMVESGEAWDDPDKEGVSGLREFAMDFIGMVFHGIT